MIKLDMYYGVVTNNNDEDKKGKVQIRILPEFKDIKESLLPWMKPFISSGFDTKNNSMNIPEIGAKLWVLTNDKFTYFKYLYGSPIEGLFDYDGVKSSLDNITELSDSEYPNIDFQLMNDGSIRFNNRISGDMGILHNTGTYKLIDTNGYIFISEVSGNKISIDDKGTLIEDSNGNSSIMSATGLVIKDKNGNEINMSAVGIKLKTGDATAWMPNTLPACLFTGAPHGGPAGGITKLTGG